MTRRIDIERPILSRNDAIAAGLRARLAEAGVFCVNVLSSPGSGKTSTILATHARLGGRFRALDLACGRWTAAEVSSGVRLCDGVVTQHIRHLQQYRLVMAQSEGKRLARIELAALGTLCIAAHAVHRSPIRTFEDRLKGECGVLIGSGACHRVGDGKGAIIRCVRLLDQQRCISAAERACRSPGSDDPGAEGQRICFSGVQYKGLDLQKATPGFRQAGDVPQAGL